MKLRSITRTSLFARMSLLFGLLVTVPLVISGIVLSLSGRRIVVDSGKNVAEIGTHAVETTAHQVGTVAKTNLDDAAAAMSEQAKQHLDTTVGKIVVKGRDAFARNTSEIKRQGEEAVQDATRRMVQVGERTVTRSLDAVRDLNRDSLGALSSKFTGRMQAELEKSANPITERLKESVVKSWETSASRRAGSVPDLMLGAEQEFRYRLQVPLRTQVVQRGDDSAGDQLKPLWQARNGSASLAAQRIVLVSPTGAEWARVPESDLPEGEDWSESPTRARFFAQPDPWTVEPLQYDERSKHWIRRLVHQVVPSSPSSEDTAPEPAPAGAKGPRQPLPLIIVDIIADDLAERATKAPLPEEMQVALIETTSGRIVSSWPKQDNPVPPPLLDVLRSAGTERTKLGPFVYTTGDAMKVHAYAHRWTDSTSKSGSPFWTVVTQPEHEVLQPVFDLTQSIQEASKKSLGAVTVESKTFIERQARKGHEKQLQLLRNAGREMRAATAPINGNVGVVLERARKKAVSEIETGLSAMTGPLQKSAAAEMQKAAEAKAEDAANAIGTAADNERDAARMQITQKAKQAANRAAGRMLLNSAWLIPLFLLLALFLATLTARSLVRPINQLVKGTQLLAAGEYHQRIAVRGDDELGRLARAFNGMAGSIETAQAELRQSHDSLAAEKTRIEGIVRASPDGLVMLEPSGQVAFINPAAIRLLNLTEEALPDAPFDLSSLPETAAHRLRACLEIATTDAPTDEPHEYEIQGPPRLVLKLRAVELCSAQGRSYGRLLHMNDVTRERIIDEMKSDFISLVSHELRTPLTSILGFSSYMLTGKLGAVVDTQKLALESIHRQAKRLSAIISDFLDISRIESGRIEMRKEPVPVAQIAARVVEDLRPQATEKHIDVSAHIEDGSLPIVAMGDEQRITQVFTNLVGNALKFTEANGRIDVVLSRKNGEVYCSVKDTGCGIPEDELDRVFDRFYQVEKVVTRKSGGTGLGLAIVKNIVEAHGGQIRIKSRLGEGTEVAFSLPSSDEAA